MKKYILIRIFIFIIGNIIAISIAFSLLDPKRWSATGDILTISFCVFIFYFIWTIFLLIESFIKHKKNQINHRNISLLMLLIVPTFIFLIYIYSLIIN